MSWIIENDYTAPETVPDNGNRMLTGNGYLGIRGTVDEAGKDQLVAINLAGIYDKVGDGWREPLNAPNPLYTLLTANGLPLRLQDGTQQSHHQSLDFYYGLYHRDTVWRVGNVSVRLQSIHTACMVDEHLILSDYTVSVDGDIDIDVTADIDTDIWEIHGPHYTHYEKSANPEQGILLCTAPVQNGKDTVVVERRCIASANCTAENNALHYALHLKKDETFSLRSVSAVYTSRDSDSPQIKNIKQEDFDALLQAHKAAWEKIWLVGAVTIDGDEKAEAALNYSLYHLNAVAPRSGKPLSIPARGLSGQTYKGAIFWDSEMFILDYFLYTQPEVARSMIEYRIDTLNGAKKKAAQYGWQGAFYAWESQDGGFDGCSDYNVTDVFTGRPMRTFFKDKQYHISAAVARAIIMYVKVTGDRKLLVDGGAETLLECGKFYYSLLLKHPDEEKWEIHDAIGPDEYHERVNNNAYTNKMAQKTMLWALEAAEMLRRDNPIAYRAFIEKTDAETILPKLKETADNIYMPLPNTQGVISQFDGYFALEDTTVDAVRARLKDPREYWGGAYGVASQTQIIKQADVIAMLELCHEDYTADIIKANWNYYSPRTEHGSSLSACMYALTACRWGNPEEAYPFFMKSALADWDGGGKQWAGLVYIGGTHPAASGGAWKVFAQGFAGLEDTPDGPTIHPQLPAAWKKISFTCCEKGKYYRVTADHEKGTIEPL